MVPNNCSSVNLSKTFDCYTMFPKLSELFYFYAIIDKRETVYISTFNSIIIKCRRLIFENEDIIAYPDLDDGRNLGIVLIVKESFYTNGNLKNCLKKYNLKVSLFNLEYILVGIHALTLAFRNYFCVRV